MQDLELAKAILRGKSLSLVIVKRGKPIFESHSSGIGGLLQAMNDLGNVLSGASAADRVVGRAAALLLTCSRTKEIYATTISKEGLKVLEENGIPVEYDNLVPKILDKEGRNICPFERFSLAIKSPNEAYEKLKSFADNLTRRR